MLPAYVFDAEADNRMRPMEHFTVLRTAPWSPMRWPSLTASSSGYHMRRIAWRGGQPSIAWMGSLLNLAGVRLWNTWVTVCDVDTSLTSRDNGFAFQHEVLEGPTRRPLCYSRTFERKDPELLKFDIPILAAKPNANKDWICDPQGTPSANASYFNYLQIHQLQEFSIQNSGNFL